MKTNRLLMIAAACMLAAAIGVIFVLLHNHPQEETQPPGPRPAQIPPSRPSQPSPPETTKHPTAQEIFADRQRLDKTVWAQEVNAQRHEDTFIALWDGMRARLDDQHALLAAFQFSDLHLRKLGQEQNLGWDLSKVNADGEPYALDHDGWQRVVAAFADAGYLLEHSEWHHSAFDIDSSGKCHSLINFKLFIHNDSLHQRLQVSGALKIDWTDQLDNHGNYIVKSAEATDVTITIHHGPDAFQEAWTMSSRQIAGGPAEIGPVLVYDLDGDGRDDIIIPALNVVFFNHSTPGHFSFEKKVLCKYPVVVNSIHSEQSITAAVLADMYGDGHADLVVTGTFLPPTIYKGDGTGFFSQHAVITPLTRGAWMNPSYIAAADLTGTRHPYLWIGQYRPPYKDGNVPGKYWDANDSFPSFLLANDGNGHLKDVTEESGLGSKRNRRSYSGSFFDLDHDGKLDLITVNDFSGVDAYLRTGSCSFKECTDQLLPERHTYGMSHAIADFDGDGVLDIFVAGMSSTTARRLDEMGLGRDDFPEWQKMRKIMAYGNRMYLGTQTGSYRLAQFDDQIARTGWTWGSSAIDVENEGTPSIYVTNGHMSRKTAKDYCTRYWTQDIYQGNSQPSDEFLSAIRHEDDIMGQVSWNGFEHKGLLKNSGGRAFRDVAYPMNLGFEWDGRSVVSADFDGDGHPDLLILENDVEQVKLKLGTGGDSSLEELHLMRNCSQDTNSWLGVRLIDNLSHSPLSALITVATEDRTYIGTIVTGDSYRSQHPLYKHFGLGGAKQVKTVQVRWADGATTAITNPPLNKVLIVDK